MSSNSLNSFEAPLDATASRSTTPITPKKSKKKKELFDVDFIGNGTYQVSQLNIFQKRSIEPYKDVNAKLSARGLNHRQKQVFLKDLQSTSAIIDNALRSDKRVGSVNSSGKIIPSTQLFPSYFQRALCHERMNEIDKAIADYNVCISETKKYESELPGRSRKAHTPGPEPYYFT